MHAYLRDHLAPKRLSAGRASHWSLVLAALLCVACPQQSHPRPPEPFTAFSTRVTPKQTGIDGPLAKVDLLGRAFLEQQAPQQPGYAYYLYLIFQTGASESDRLAAAHAFLGEVPAGEIVEYTGDPSSIALLAVPIKKPTGSQDPEPTKEAQILQRYDWARAAVIASRVRAAGVQLPPVAIVAYPWPIEATSPALNKDLIHQGDMCGNFQTAKIKLDRIHEELKQGEFDTARTVSVRVRAAFEALGQLVTTGQLNPCGS